MRGAAILFLTLALASGADAREPVEGGWRLVWSDEFEGRAIDRGKWAFDVDCWGGGNSERQCYTDRPAHAARAEASRVGQECGSTGRLRGCPYTVKNTNNHQNH